MISPLLESMEIYKCFNEKKNLSSNNNGGNSFLHFSNYGKTLANKHYKYLASVDSIWDLLSPNLITYKDYTYNQLEKIFNISFNKNTLFKITTKDNRQFISIDNHLFTLEEVENKLSFCSSKYFFMHIAKAAVNFR